MAQFKPAGIKQPAASGLAASEGRVFVSYGGLNAANNQRQPSGNTMLVMDAASGKLLKHVPCENPGDLKLGADGKLYMVCGTTKIVTVDPETAALTTVVDGLQNIRCASRPTKGEAFRRPRRTGEPGEGPRQDRQARPHYRQARRA